MWRFRSFFFLRIKMLFFFCFVFLLRMLNVSKWLSQVENLLQDLPNGSVGKPVLKKALSSDQWVRKRVSVSLTFQKSSVLTEVSL